MQNAEAKLQYGKIHLREALRNMRTARYEEAVPRVSEFHASEQRQARTWSFLLNNLC
jgi:hypothetical protein